MAEQFTDNFSFSYYAEHDSGWHTGRNNSIIALDAYLKEIGTGPNFLPSTLFQIDTDSDGIPQLWTISADSCTITQALVASEVYGFAKKIQITISNSSGSTKYPEFKISSQVPPELKVIFSAWLKSADLAVQLRMYDGTTNFDSTAQVEATVARRDKAGTIDTSATDLDVIVRITVPNGTVTKVVDVHLPMLQVGTKVCSFVPSVGEMAQFLANDIFTNNITVYSNATFTDLTISNDLSVGNDLTVTNDLNVSGKTITAGQREEINITAKTANYTIVATDENIKCDTSGGAFWVKMPATPTAGDTYAIILETAGNDLTVDGNGKNIIGASTAVLTTSNESITLIYGGTQWSLK